MIAIGSEDFELVEKRKSFVIVLGQPPEPIRKFNQPKVLENESKSYVDAVPAFPNTYLEEVYLSERAVEDMMNHLKKYRKEHGGFLLGKVMITNRGLTTVVYEAIPAVGAISESTRVIMHPETWIETMVRLDTLREKGVTEATLVGWYHSHPFGSPKSVFLSAMDLEVMTRAFRFPYHVAIVVEPMTESRGLFGWRRGRVELIPESYIFRGDWLDGWE